MKSSQSSTETPAPNASQDASGWRRRGEYSNRSATDAIASATPSGQRAIRQTASKLVAQVERVADRRAAHEHHERQQREHAGGQREPQPGEVLAQERAVALHAVDPVRAALDLAHRRRPGEDRREPPAASAVSPDSCPLSEPCRSASVRISPGAPGVRSWIVSRTKRVKSSWPSAAARPDDRDQRGQQRERHLERERARMAEAVGRAEANDRVHEQPPPAGAPQRLECLVALELAARGRDRAGGRHGSVEVDDTEQE